jgi:UDP-N-acetylglucosamine 2-epimerase (non-hydrolysing)
MSILIVVGARPNFMKCAPVIEQMLIKKIDFKLVHTGQHYDKNMSDEIFLDLEIPKPDYHMRVGSGTHAKQTALIMNGFEKICDEVIPKLVIVAGDVNSTLACALVASKKNIPIAHIESGLRSFDNSMPEEINRILVDRISQILFVTEQSGLNNLLNEGIDKDKVHFVGNSMIDSLLKVSKSINNDGVLDSFNIKRKRFCLVTLHRPSNVDGKENIKKVINILNILSKTMPIVFPVHPRTKKQLYSCKVPLSENIKTCDALSYKIFVSLLENAKVVLTDSGGVQEETTFFKTPCITYRENTERPITVQIGTNYLTGTDKINIIEVFKKIISGNSKSGSIPPKWDGNSGKRIVSIIDNYINGQD